MKRRVLSIFLVLLMAVMLVPGAAMTVSAAPLTEKIDLTGATADASGDGWSWDNSTKTFTMNGLDLTVADDDGILLPDKTNLVIMGINTVTVTGNIYDGIESDGALNITGTGTLVIVATDDAIQCGEVTINGPTLDITADYGVYADDDCGNGYVKIISGALIVEAESIGIFADSDVIISGGRVDITADDDEAVYAGNDAIISGGRVDITADGAEGICTYGDIFISGGELEVDSYDESLYAADGIVISGGKIDAYSEDDDVIYAADGNITISNATVIVSGEKNYDGLDADSGTVNDDNGNIYINSGADVSITDIKDNAIEADENIVITGNARITITNSKRGMVADKVIINGGMVTVDTKLLGIDVNEAVYFNAGEVSLVTSDADKKVAEADDKYIYFADGVTMTNGVSAGFDDGAGNYDEIRMTSALPVIIKGAVPAWGLPILPGAEDTKYMPFTDVLRGAWYYDDVFYCYDNGIMDGVDTYTFAPDQSITRGMIVAILWRNEGRPYATGEGFNDVAKGMYYTDAVKWAVSKGIVKGYGDGTFRPDEPVSLEELAAIMFRYAAYKNLDTTARGGLSVYNDSDEIAQWAKSAMSWAEAYNMIDGIVGGRLKPANAATRAQAAAMLARLPKAEEEQAVATPGEFFLNPGQAT